MALERERDKLRAHMMDGFSKTIAANIEAIKMRIAEVCRKQRRDESSVELMAVTKTQEWPAVEAAISSGIRRIGENRVQEAAEKFPERWPFTATRDFIGHLQKNKVKKAVAIFDCIQSVDSIELLELIEKEASAMGKTIDILFEMNISAEETKHGVENEDELFKMVEVSAELAHIRAIGLMAIGPLVQDEITIRNAFARLRRASEACYRRFPLANWGTLSMGMSGDFELAIAEGSTLVRIGTALFGERPIPARAER